MSKTKKNSMRRKTRKVNKSKKNMKGGFAQDEIQHLIDNGFQQNQIDELSQLNITIYTINQAIEYYNNNFNAHQIIVDIAKNLHANLPPLNNIGLQGDTSEVSVNNNSQTSNNSQNNSNAPLLNLSDLQSPAGDEIPQDPNDIHDIDMNESLDLSGETSMPDDSMNNSSIGSSLNNTTSDITNNSMTAGKRRKYSKRHNNNLKNKKSHRKIKGGALYGNGYGANCNEPNYSIYNKSLTKLFPYKP